jgi:hypothetical protein
VVDNFKENLFSNFLVIIRNMKYTPEEKIFMYKKYMLLGSPTLVQRA